MTVIEARPIVRTKARHPAREPERERFTVLGDESTLTFFATSSLYPVYGRAAGLAGFVEAAWNSDGAIVAEPAPRMHVELKVESLRTGNELQDREMWKLIDSKRFPKIAADLRELGPSASQGRYAATGSVTLAGLARTYEGELKPVRESERVTVVGDLNVDVRDFGLKPMNLLVLSVAPLVRVHLHLVAAREN